MATKSSTPLTRRAHDKRMSVKNVENNGFGSQCGFPTTGNGGPGDSIQEVGVTPASSPAVTMKALRKRPAVRVVDSERSPSKEAPKGSASPTVCQSLTVSDGYVWTAQKSNQASSVEASTLKSSCLKFTMNTTTPQAELNKGDGKENEDGQGQEKEWKQLQSNARVAGMPQICLKPFPNVLPTCKYDFRMIFFSLCHEKF